MMTFEEIRSMSDEEIAARYSELSAILDGPMGDEWDKAYEDYSRLRAVEDERYRERYQDEFDAFYEAHIKGKKWEDIDPEDWGAYSDWHKDMYGFRPRHI